MPMVTANNANFYYERHGAGQPLIFISGYTSDHVSWSPQLDRLSKDYEVIIFDNRGAGQTRDDGCELSAELMADDVVALAAALQLEKPHVIGSSMGGTIAQQIAIRHPDKINKLGLMVTTAKWRHSMLMGTDSSLKLRELDIDFKIQFDAILGWVFGQEFLSKPGNIQFMWNRMVNNPFPQSLENQKRQYNVLKNHDVTGLLHKITVPTLVMYGDEDIISLQQESKYLAKHINDSKLVCSGTPLVSLVHESPASVDL